MLKKRKLFLSLVLVAILVMSFGVVASADNTGSYIHYGFSKYFYTTDTIMKNSGGQNLCSDTNYYYRRVSDGDTSAYYYSRIYNGTIKASDSYMTVYSGVPGYSTLKDPYYNSSAGYVYRLKIQNRSGVKYEVAGDYSLT